MFRAEKGILNESLKQCRTVRTTSKTFTLHPFLQKDILHVSGRCANTETPDNSAKCESARLVVRDAQLKTLETVAETRTRLWIPAGRNKVRNNCITCCRFSLISKKLLMGFRLNQGQEFLLSHSAIRLWVPIFLQG